MICGFNVRVGDEPVQLHLLCVRGNVRFAHGTRYATVCVRLLWLTPSRETSIAAVCTHISCLLQSYCLVVDVTDLVIHVTTGYHMVAGLVVWWAVRASFTTCRVYKREVGPRVLVLPVAVVGRPRHV